MKIVEEKIEKFKTDIMIDIGTKKNRIMEETEKEIKKTFEEKELEYLAEAYESIQNGLKKIDREKNEILSKSIMDSKKKLLQKRGQIINGVFEDATKKLIEFTQEEGYYDYLLQMIKEALDKIGDDSSIIYIAQSDEKYLNNLIKEFGPRVEIESKKVTMIGGCKVYNKHKNMYLDDSFYTKLYEQKEDFLYKCKLEIQ